MINQLAVDVQRIYSLGVKKISVTALQPLGCLPTNTAESSFQQCNDTFNQAVAFHNLLLQEVISKFINQTTQVNSDASSKVVIVDLYNAFFSIFQEKPTQQGESFILYYLLSISNFLIFLDDVSKSAKLVQPMTQ